MSAIKGDYRTHKHIPSRTCYQLIIEVAEEDFPEVCRTLGYPKTGENTYVAIALLNKEAKKEPWFAPKETKVGYKHVLSDEPIKEITEGDKLRIRAIMLCKDDIFQHFARSCLREDQLKTYNNLMTPFEQVAKEYLCATCEVESRSELATNPEAQTKFKELLSRYDQWKLSKTYKDNLNR